jgi:APA family basic amino acid/polyamine antiporter
MSAWSRRKPIDSQTSDHDGPALARTLSWPHLVALGVGAIVGTGILTLIGVGADRAGPAVLISFALAGLVCACAALAYAELATLMPASGGAYTYSYSVLGEGIAWIVGWSLILEYSLVVSAVAVGWSGYFVGFWNGLEGGLFESLRIPAALAGGPHVEGGLINLPAMLIVALVAGMLLLGTGESATLNAVLVAIKIAALVAFVAIALPAFDPGNFTPFMPYGFGAPFLPQGVMAAAAIIFFAFYGFDAIATAAEETKRPERDLAIGIVGSMLVCTALYLLVAAAAVGARPFTTFADSPEPLALILRDLGQGVAAQWIAAAAVIALPTVLLAFLFGQSRIFLVMARDGLLPRGLSRVSARGVPAVVTIFTAVVTAALAGFLRLDELASLANAGTLAAFTAVGVCLVVLRRREPDRPRTFRTPAYLLVGAITVIGCIIFFTSLPLRTQIWFAIWNVAGLAAYLLYGMRRSRLALARRM